MSDEATPAPTLHLIKLSVGTDSVEGLTDWQADRSAARKADGLDPRPRHVTRMWPRRAEELLQGGSIYWVINGAVQARQRIDTLQEAIGEDGIRRCAIILVPGLIRTRQRPRRPFQGWRYLAAADAPPDLGPREVEDQLLPDELRDALTRFGVLGR
ncbi:MAG: DUF1489 domain-containing protein [Pseudomonadota bacterium]